MSKIKALISITDFELVKMGCPENVYNGIEVTRVIHSVDDNPYIKWRNYKMPVSYSEIADSWDLDYFKKAERIVK